VTLSGAGAAHAPSARTQSASPPTQNSFVFIFSSACWTNA
jgi:hypothetical protein